MAGRRSRHPEITPELLLRAYSIGLFPMADSADDPELFWVEPDMRGVIPLDDFHVSRSLAKTIRKNPFEIRFDTAFDAVLAACAEAAPDRPSTWINAKIKSLYGTLHRMGHAHSIEVLDGEGCLVGGLYGVAVGRMFYGESMFSGASGGSKVALAALARVLHGWGWPLLDAQLENPHLLRLGAQSWPRERFLAEVRGLVALPGLAGSWKDAFGRVPARALASRHPAQGGTTP